MLRIKNNSLQSFEIYLMTEAGRKMYWIQPGASLIVPNEYLTEHVKLLRDRKILEIKPA